MGERLRGADLMADTELEPVLDAPGGRERMNRARGLRSGTLRWAWATLTSMRTALGLLLLLGLASIPGSLLPQRPTNPFGVATWLEDHPDIGPWLDRLGFFDVFGSVWFSAIYLLLFGSLIGCIIPRCAAFYRALRAQPGPLPRRFSRFPDHASGRTDTSAAAVLDAAEAHLREAGYRVHRETAETSPPTVRDVAVPADATAAPESPAAPAEGERVVSLVEPGERGRVVLPVEVAEPDSVPEVAAPESPVQPAEVSSTPLGISAERGYLREAGNLVFHLALVVMLVGLAWSSLFGYKGTAIVVEGQAFSDTLTQFDEFSGGVGFRPSQLPAFTIGLDRFEVQFETGPTQTGAARLFRAHVTVTEPGRQPEQRQLEVNAPLSLGGADVHLLGHGYAPVVTVRDGNGDIAYSGPVVFLPQDTNFTSNGVIKAPDARPERLAFEGVFLPTAQIDAQGMRSAFPDALRPQLLINVWAGPPKDETGVPENIYTLDQTGLTQLVRSDGQPVRAGLEPGTSFDLPDGRGSISFDGLRRWTKLQVSANPGGWLVLGSVLVAIAGLTVSLLMRPRRLFVRVRPAAEGGGSDVEVAGLDRVDGRPGLPEAVAALALACGIDPDGSRLDGRSTPVSRPDGRATLSDTPSDGREGN
ncbi:MAG: cytochrome c biogenesis protein ResB [Propionicimonas sp.]|nr:cytochrome c biogenesis protein ResB [Propionicimonas sp.]